VPAPAALPPAPKIIPASAVQYLEPPAPEYPRLSRRNAEIGRVMLRVFIDVAGMPHNVQVSSSSGFARLDGAAVSAVQKARFKPYTENGQPSAGWTYVPIDFELEK
jgi:protein TonB